MSINQSKTLKFDDVVTDQYGTWATICEDCCSTHNINTEGLERTVVEEKCDVHGCNNTATFYIEIQS